MYLFVLQLYGTHPNLLGEIKRGTTLAGKHLPIKSCPFWTSGEMSCRKCPNKKMSAWGNVRWPVHINTVWGLSASSGSFVYIRCTATILQILGSSVHFRVESSDPKPHRSVADVLNHFMSVSTFIAILRGQQEDVLIQKLLLKAA